MATERTSRRGLVLRLVSNNGQPVPAPAPVEVPSSHAGDSWYHEDAVVQEKQARERDPR